MGCRDTLGVGVDGFISAASSSLLQRHDAHRNRVKQRLSPLRNFTEQFQNGLVLAVLDLQGMIHGGAQPWCISDNRSQ
jgi:hypothetical protein